MAPLDQDPSYANSGRWTRARSETQKLSGSFGPFSRLRGLYLFGSFSSRTTSLGNPWSRGDWCLRAHLLRACALPALLLAPIRRLQSIIGIRSKVCFGYD